MGHRSVSRPLVFTILYWIFTGHPLGYPVVTLCHRDPVVLDLQDWPFHVFIDGVDAGVGQLKALDLSRGGS